MNPQFGHKEMMPNASKRLSHDVCKLMMSGRMNETNKAFHKLVPHKVTIELNVFGAFMEDGVPGNVYGSLIITFNRNRCDIGNCKLMQKVSQP